MPAPRRALIIDDEEPLRRLLHEYLGSRGWEVTVAADGLEGFRAASRGTFDLITMDIKMPGVNGVESLRSMSLTGQGAKVVVISGFLTRDIDEDCRAAGAAAVMGKPFDLAALGALADELVPPVPEAGGR